MKIPESLPFDFRLGQLNTSIKISESKYQRSHLSTNKLWAVSMEKHKLFFQHQLLYRRLNVAPATKLCLTALYEEICKAVHRHLGAPRTAPPTPPPLMVVLWAPGIRVIVARNKISPKPVQFRRLFPPPHLSMFPKILHGKFLSYVNRDSSKK